MNLGPAGAEVESRTGRILCHCCNEGARGYMLKSMPPRELVESIRQVHAGKKRIPSAFAAHLAEHYRDEALTAREVEVLQQVAAGRLADSESMGLL